MANENLTPPIAAAETAPETARGAAPETASVAAPEAAPVAAPEDRVDLPPELRAAVCCYAYACEPQICGAAVCCGKFDIVVTAAEREMIERLREALQVYGPHLRGAVLFHSTRHFVFLTTYHARCILNFPLPTGGYGCALHAWALAHGKNPYHVKPRGCALAPFSCDGAGNLTLTANAAFPCLRVRPTPAAPDKNLLTLLAALKTRGAVENEEIACG
jgi:hypothetical protein